MPRYEYKVVPAPSKGKKAKGVRGVEARFSYALEDLMNSLAADGWEYQRSETLPSVERAGLTSSTTEWRNVMVFRRVAAGDVSNFEPELLPAPTAVAMTAPALVAVAVDAETEAEDFVQAETPQVADTATQVSQTVTAEDEPFSAEDPDENARADQAIDPVQSDTHEDDEDTGKNTGEAEVTSDTEAAPIAKASMHETEKEGWDNGVEDTGNVERLSSSLEVLASARNTSKTDA